MTERPFVPSIPYRDPVRAFQRLAADPFAVLLDGAADAGGRGDHADLCVDSFRVAVARAGGVRGTKAQ